MSENETIIIIPKVDKPLKVIFNENPCPRNSLTRCKYSEITSGEDFTASIICTKEKCIRE